MHPLLDVAAMAYMVVGFAAVVCGVLAVVLVLAFAWLHDQVFLKGRMGIVGEAAVVLGLGGGVVFAAIAFYLLAILLSPLLALMKGIMVFQGESI